MWRYRTRQISFAKLSETTIESLSSISFFQPTDDLNEEYGIIRPVRNPLSKVYKHSEK